MTIAATTGIDSMLQAMQSAKLHAQGGHALAQITRARSLDGPEQATEVSFASVLQSSLQRVSAAQHAADAQARRFDLGDPDISLNDVMIDMQKASLAFQMSVQVRNKLVSAYKEISSMAM